MTRFGMILDLKKQMFNVSFFPHSFFIPMSLNLTFLAVKLEEHPFFGWGEGRLEHPL